MRVPPSYHIREFLTIWLGMAYSARSKLHHGEFSGKALSKCMHASEFKISLASKVSKSKACTNVPVKCRLCTEVHWKYNMHQHLQVQHPAWENDVLDRQELQEFHEKITICQEEETRLGIPDKRQIVNTNMHHANPLYLPSIHNERGDSLRRLRQEAVNTMVSHSQVHAPPIQLPLPLNLHPHFDTSDVFI